LNFLVFRPILVKGIIDFSNFFESILFALNVNIYLQSISVKRFYVQLVSQHH